METVSENTSDWVVAPLFFLAIGGPALMMAYKVLAAIIAISLLAAGIKDMKFREPDPFYFEWPTESGASFQQVVVQMEALPLVQVVLFWLFIIIFTFIILLILNPKYRWRILRAVLRAALFFIFITWVMKTIARRLADEVPPEAGGGLTNPPAINPNSLPVYSPLPGGAVDLLCFYAGHPSGDLPRRMVAVEFEQPSPVPIHPGEYRRYRQGHAG